MLLLLLYLLHHASPFKPHVWMKERERGENDKQKEEEGGGKPNNPPMMIRAQREDFKQNAFSLSTVLGQQVLSECVRLVRERKREREIRPPGIEFIR